MNQAPIAAQFEFRYDSYAFHSHCFYTDAERLFLRRDTLDNPLYAVLIPVLFLYNRYAFFAHYRRGSGVLDPRPPEGGKS
jgi:hypothetical protein